jgi:hypothetical protein
MRNKLDLTDHSCDVCVVFSVFLMGFWQFSQQTYTNTSTKRKMCRDRVRPDERVLILKWYVIL